MAIHITELGAYVISSGDIWLPGAFESKRAARYGFRLSPSELQRLQDIANTRAGGSGGVITWSDIAEAAKALHKNRNAKR